MSNVIHFPQQTGAVINIEAVRNSRQLKSSLIAPATESIRVETTTERAADPIKNLDDIISITDYLVTNGKWRDNMLFIVGINFGLRVSDLLRLRFSDLIDETFCFRDSFEILEKKTQNTRKRKKNRYVAINDAVVEAVTLYLENTPDVKLDDYLFQSESNRGYNTGEAMTRQSVDKILKAVAKEVGLDSKLHISTHTLRKTFGYHQMVMSGNDHRKLLLLQKMFGHSTAAQTLDYIGITDEEIDEAYRMLNLGSRTQSYGKLFGWAI